MDNVKLVSSELMINRVGCFVKNQGLRSNTEDLRKWLTPEIVLDINKCLTWSIKNTISHNAFLGSGLVSEWVRFQRNALDLELCQRLLCSSASPPWRPMRRLSRLTPQAPRAPPTRRTPLATLSWRRTLRAPARAAIAVCQNSRWWPRSVA